ncbi:hypothetical protein [Selenomonas felix]|nr:hypothetical protein [Selenomonas felix]
MAGRKIKGVLVRRQLHKGYARKWKTTRYAGGYLLLKIFIISGRIDKNGR